MLKNHMVQNDGQITGLFDEGDSETMQEPDQRIRDFLNSVQDRLDNTEVLEVLLVVELGTLRSLQSLAYTKTVMILFSWLEFMPKTDLKVFYWSKTPKLK